MLRVTFYSYKGGVGRTLALLNVAALLARRGRRVVAVDLDLEAPGFGLSELTRSPEGRPVRGVSELLLERRAGENLELGADAYAYSILPEGCGERLWLMPVGQRAKELSDAIPELYQDLEDPSARLFDLLVAEIHGALAPDYLFFDSRTGAADVAGVCTLELPQVVVAVCGLSEQNVAGMASVLRQIRQFREEGSMPEVATLLVLSPVPRLAENRQESGLSPEQELLASRMAEVERQILAPLHEEFGPGFRAFPNLRQQDLLHQLDYDPVVPLTGELQLTRSSTLSQQYRGLALSLARAATDKELVLIAPWDAP